MFRTPSIIESKTSGAFRVASSRLFPPLERLSMLVFAEQSMVLPPKNEKSMRIREFPSVKARVRNLKPQR